MRSGVHGGLKVIVDSTEVTPSSSETNSSICSVTCGPMGQPGEVSVKVTCDVARLDLDPVDESQLDEVETELGIDDVGEGGFDIVDGRHEANCSSHVHQAP